MNYKASYSLIDGFNTFANFININGSTSPLSGVGGGEDKEALEGYFAVRTTYTIISIMQRPASVSTALQSSGM